MLILALLPILLLVLIWRRLENRISGLEDNLGLVDRNVRWSLDKLDTIMCHTEPKTNEERWPARKSERP